MRNFLLLSALCLGVSAAGRADTVFTLINNTYEGGGLATGTVTIDPVYGEVVSENVMVAEGGSTYLFTLPSPGFTLANNLEYEEYSYDPAGDVLVFLFPVNTLVGYAGGDLCMTTKPNCPDVLGDLDTNNYYVGYVGILDNTGTENDYRAVTGALGTTPEPSSLLLLGTGMVATLGAARRRLSSPQV